MRARRLSRTFRRRSARRVGGGSGSNVTLRADHGDASFVEGRTFDVVPKSVTS